MDDFVAYTSRWRTGILFLGSLAFVVLGAWMAGLLGPPPVSGRASPVVVVTWGWIVIAFFGMCVVVSAKIWWDNHEQLRIGKLGIRWSRWSEQTIPWDEISDVTEWRYKRTRSIILHIRHPSLFPGRGILGLMGRANRALTGGDVSISLAATDRNYNEAMAAIAKFRSNQ